MNDENNLMLHTKRKGRILHKSEEEVVHSSRVIAQQDVERDGKKLRIWMTEKTVTITTTYVKEVLPGEE